MAKSMREIYNECSAGGETPNLMMASCERCGELVQFSKTSFGTVIIHDGCDQPMVTLISDNPRKLGVISGIT